MYMHTFTRFCESQRRFSLFSPLNIYISLFYLCLPDLSLLPVCCRAPPCSLLRSACPSAPAAVCSVAVVPCVLWWLPSLVKCQAQNSVTMWADAPRIYPRPCLLLPMCCRVFRCPFRGFRPSVRVCVLLPCVVWW